MVLLKVVHSLKIYQNTKFYGPTLSAANFAFTSIHVRYSIKKCGFEDTFNGMTSLQNFTNIYQLCEISSSHGGEYDVQNCLLGCTAV
jgi:hypothetical protein